MSANSMLGLRSIIADEATVENVTVAVPPLLLTVTGLVLPNEQLACAAVKATVDVIAQESVTVPVYPLVEATVTLACAEPSGVIDAGFAAPAESE
jgi:hypothetical protein